MIPMVVLQVKDKDAGLLVMSEISGPDEIVEGETPEFRVQVRSSSGKSLFDEVRVDLEASVSPGAEVSGTGTTDGDADEKQKELPKQVLYVAPQGVEAAFKIAPDLLEATGEERREGALTRILTVTALYRDGLRSCRKARSRRITVHLNSEVVVRRIGKTLGGILGVTPKGMR